MSARTYVTIYGCDHDEAALFREKAAAFDITPVVTSAPVSENNIRLTAGSRSISIGHKNHVSNAQLTALRAAGVEYISTRSIGYNHLDVDFAHSLGISVENVAYSPDSVADYTLMLILMILRHAKSTIRHSDAHDYRLHPARGRELRDLTVGVVGTGRIGAAVISRLRGFGCRVVAFDTRQAASVEYVTLEDLLEQSDVVTLHTPLDATTRHLLDRSRLAQLRRGAYVVNTARGGLIDTDALVCSLEAGALAGAALDVLENEEGTFYTDQRERVLENTALVRLQKLPNAIVSPHSAYYTDHSLRDTVENTLTNCQRFEGNQPA